MRKSLYINGEEVNIRVSAELVTIIKSQYVKNMKRYSSLSMNIQIPFSLKKNNKRIITIIIYLGKHENRPRVYPYPFSSIINSGHHYAQTSNK